MNEPIFSETILEDSEILPIYANSFGIAGGSSDVVIELTCGKEHVATVNMSYELAKTLSLKLMDVVKVLESKTGGSIMTTDHINKFMFGSQSPAAKERRSRESKARRSLDLPEPSKKEIE